MMKLGTYQLGTLIELCKAKLKILTSKDIPVALWKDYLNLATSTIKDLSGTKDFNDYKADEDIYFYLSAYGINILKADISTFIDYKNIDNIYLLRDVYYGNYTRINNEVEFFNITEPNNYSANYRTKIIWCNSGEKLYIAVGPNSPYIDSTIKMHYIRNPIKMQLLSDYIDVKDSNINQVLDIVTLYALQNLKEPIPAFLNQAKQDVMQIKNSTIEERQTILSERTDPK